MTKTSIPPKLFYSIAELAEEWGYNPDEVLHLIRVGLLEASIKLYGSFKSRPIIGKEPPLMEELFDQKSYNKTIQEHSLGLYELPHEYINSLIENGITSIEQAYCDFGRRYITFTEVQNVTVDNLVVRTEEVNRFAAKFNQIQPINKLSENEREKYLKMIGSLALLLADYKTSYKKGESPNASNISKKILETFDEIIKNGVVNLQNNELGHTKLRNAISEGLKLLLVKE